MHLNVGWKAARKRGRAVASCTPGRLGPRAMTTIRVTKYERMTRKAFTAPEAASVCISKNVSRPLGRHVAQCATFVLAPGQSCTFKISRTTAGGNDATRAFGQRRRLNRPGLLAGKAPGACWKKSDYPSLPADSGLYEPGAGSVPPPGRRTRKCAPFFCADFPG